MCKNCDWEEYKDLCDIMLGEGKYTFAENTILGISEWIFDNEHITEKQKEALDNICNSIEE
ncbi:MAG: hypothetical protein ACYS76_09715 [Planctomycetota bacterium]|jgi:hypothetical protein